VTKASSSKKKFKGSESKLTKKLRRKQQWKMYWFSKLKSWKTRLLQISSGAVDGEKGILSCGWGGS
jgi:hypothetical protein